MEPIGNDGPVAGAGAGGSSGGGLGAGATGVNACGGSVPRMPVAAGEVIVLRHLGQGPEIPAMREGTVSTVPQKLQENWTTSSTAAVMRGERP